jgi:hypothetical protein
LRPPEISGDIDWLAGFQTSEQGNMHSPFCSTHDQNFRHRLAASTNSWVHDFAQGGRLDFWWQKASIRAISMCLITSITFHLALLG